MKKIQVFYHKRLRQEEAFGFHQLAYPEFQQCGEDFAQVLVPYKKALEDFDLALATARKSELTTKIRVLDTRRDVAYRGLRRQVQASLQHINPGKLTAAQKVDLVLSRYPDPTHLPYIEENGVLDNLLTDLKPLETTGSIAILDATEWLVELKTTHAEFVKAFMNRNTEQSVLLVGKIKETRLTLDDAYRDCVERINAHLLVNGEGTLGSAIDKINQLITYQTNVLAQRSATNKKKAPTDGKQDPQNPEP